jgi:mannosylglucosylglycerate synthase
VRVALVHYTAPPVVGGVEQVLARQARLLAEAGHAVTVVAGRGRQPDPGVAFVRVPRADTRHPDVLAVQAALDGGSVPRAFGELRTRLERALGAAVEGHDVVIAHNVCSLHKNLALTAALHHLSGVAAFPRLVAWHHDLAWAAARYRADLHPGQPWDLLRTAWPGVLHVAVSEERREALAGILGIPPAAIEVVENGIDREEFLGLGPRTRAVLEPLALDGAGPILLLPVRTSPRKNIELALQVLAALRAGGDDARLLVTGPPDPHDLTTVGYKEMLLGLRAELDLEDAAHFLSERGDTLADSVVADLYRVADALFLPSRDEGFGLPLLEAAASRLPILCAGLPSFRAIAGPHAAFFSPDDEPAAVAALVRSRLAADPAYGLAVRVRRQYDWRRIYRDRIEPLLERVAAGRR